MTAPSKILGKKLRLRSTIFARRTVSRQKLIELTGLNERTVIRYAEELKGHHLISERVDDTMRGRPRVVYTSNSEQCLFPGFWLSRKAFYLAAVDINGFPVSVRQLAFPEEQPDGERWKRIFALTDEWMPRFLERIPGTAEISYDVSCRRSSAFVEQIGREFMRRYRIPVEPGYSDDLLFWHYAMRTGNTGSMLGVVCGAGFYATLISHGEIVGLKPGLLRNICGSRVDGAEGDSDFPYGKCGTAEAELSYEGAVTRYNRYAGSPLPESSPVAAFNQIQHLALSGSSAALRTIDDYNRILGMVLARLDRCERFDSVVLLNNRRYHPDVVRSHFGGRDGGPFKPVALCSFSNAEAVFSPALHTLHQLMNYQNGKDSSR